MLNYVPSLLKQKTVFSIGAYLDPSSYINDHSAYNKTLVDLAVHSCVLIYLTKMCRVSYVV
jgi:hypothetical protein